MSYKNSCVKFNAFSRRNDLFIFLRMQGQEGQVIKCLEFDEESKNYFYILSWVWFESNAISFKI